jgi:hypothetical protein
LSHTTVAVIVQFNTHANLRSFRVEKFAPIAFPVPRIFRVLVLKCIHDLTCSEFFDTRCPNQPAVEITTYATIDLKTGEIEMPHENRFVLYFQLKGPITGCHTLAQPLPCWQTLARCPLIQQYRFRIRNPFRPFTCACSSRSLRGVGKSSFRCIHPHTCVEQRAEDDESQSRPLGLPSLCFDLKLLRKRSC